jgi:hypothetical protein
MYQTDCRRVNIKSVKGSLNNIPPSFQVFDKINSSKEVLHSDPTRTHHPMIRSSSSLTIQQTIIHKSVMQKQQ